MNMITKWLLGKSKKKSEQEAEERYQVKEFEGKIWLTKDSALVCPMDMFKKDTIETLAEIRELYVQRNTTK